MSEPVFRWLTADDMTAYGALCAQVQADMVAKGIGSFIDFLTVPQCYTAAQERRIGSLWIDNSLAATLITEPCDLGGRLNERFTGEDLADFTGDAIYLRNGMVSPAFLGRGLYTTLMKTVAVNLDGHALVGTINADNIAPQKSCMAAGLAPTGELIRKKDGVRSIVFYRPAIAISSQAVA